ncbi:rhotekin-2 [Xenopus laevis]|uniref:Rhotekin-2 n=2 Tax=Xenopus laevis TaxID=8355 RepID=RTKN2_XENLA|nr:rhotekin-2 [Xenopus laevis]Q5XGX5.1 RecName: Full=Rhotekin-2; AltName: Full=Pleckstrin homology domain-containing family K member 1; Short=PH domain-containing family K member 1 [Xenopus laevis]AAH84302.1 LOC495119 protein [Xenopus laevis]
MEIKRKKIRESALFPREDDCLIQEKLDFEIRMRDGICKLLSVSSQKEQLLNAVKNLMVCNARIQNYTAQLRSQMGESNTGNTGRRSSDVGLNERQACPGKVAISGIRIPLMWKDSDHFSNKEKTQRHSVFCMLRLGPEIHDTDMVIVDKTMTDICFDNVTVFADARSDFQLKLELYSCCMEDSSIANTPKKLARKLRNSIGKSAGKKFNSELEATEPEAFLFSTPHMPGARYSLLAQITFTLDSIEDNFRTHSLTITGHEDSSFWLPLYGSMCCRLVAQPACLTDEAMMGFLNQQEMVGGLRSYTKFYCVLKGGNLLCYYTPEEINAKVEPALTVPINKETRIRAVGKDSKSRASSFSVINVVSGEAVTKVFSADCKEELQKWMEAFWQHFYDLSQWKHCSEKLMKINETSPQKPPLFLTREPASVYHDMSIGSPMKLESITDIIHNKIEETDGQFLIGPQEESAPAPWAALFDGNHQLHVERNKPPLLSSDDPSTSSNVKAKKRRAPPPPPNKTPFSKLVEGNDPSDKENIWSRASLVRKSFDTKLSAIMHQLQRPMVVPLTPAPPEKIEVTENKAELDTGTQEPIKPVPTPRQKSLREKLDPRVWLQSQV